MSTNRSFLVAAVRKAVNHVREITPGTRDFVEGLEAILMEHNKLQKDRTLKARVITFITDLKRCEDCNAVHQVIEIAKGKRK